MLGRSVKSTANSYGHVGTVNSVHGKQLRSCMDGQLIPRFTATVMSGRSVKSTVNSYGHVGTVSLVHGKQLRSC